MERYICLDCGNSFKLDAVRHFRETHGFTDGSFEEITCCPYCGGSYEKADVCEKCGTAFEQEDFALFAGRWCHDCLMDMIDTDNFIEFVQYYNDQTDSREIGLLEQFYFNKVWCFDYCDMPNHSSLEMKRDLLDLIRASAAMDTFMGVQNRTGFLDKCKDFIMEDRDCADMFAEWLAKKEGK